MTKARTVVTIDATALGEHLEAQAEWAEQRAAFNADMGWGTDWYDGIANTYRGLLTTITEQIELGADGFLVVER